MNNTQALTIVIALTGQAFLTSSAFAHDKHQGHIRDTANAEIQKAFDLIHAKVVKNATSVTFQAQVEGDIGQVRPTANGRLNGAEVYSYVWPTNLGSSVVGFEANQEILALAVTVHPDFDDTPKYDENRDANNANDGDLWHSHWVVLSEDAQCPAGLKVKDIPEGQTPKLPDTWPQLPILIDSPGYQPHFAKNELTIEVPIKDINFQQDFRFDAVISVLKVNDSIHNPLLCISLVHDIAPGDLSLPGKTS